ncbi:MAG: TonB-dependent receptor [Pseudomonadales bacterium]|nr:TonB-dependent receptor [Pseudomonadales bacterium]
MHTTQAQRRTLPSRVLQHGLTGFVLAAMAWSLQVRAADDEGQIEEVVVTGSLIKRDNFDSASPLQILDSQDIVAEATPSLGEIINNQTFNYGGDSFASHYSITNPEGNRTSANFRGLGAGATLTLLDGKDLYDENLNNIIPQIAIDRIDILKDGASAVYGTDAVAGVINVIPVKNFDGVEVSAQYQMDSEGDHNEYVVNFLIGNSTDNGYFTFAMEGRERTVLMQTERPELLANSFGSSGTGNPGSYNVPIRDATGAISGAQQLADPGCGVATSPGGNGQPMTGNYRNNISGRLNSSGSTCLFEFGEFFNFVTPNNVLNAYLNYEYQFTDDLVYESSMGFSHMKTTSRGSPTNPGGSIRDVNRILGGIVGDHPGNPWRAFYDANGNGVIDDDGTELLYALDANGDGVPDRADPVGTEINGAVLLPADPFQKIVGSTIPFNEDVTIAALRLFGKMGTLPSNLDSTGANLGYATYDVTVFRTYHDLILTLDNGWEITASYGYEEQTDINRNKNNSFNAVLLGLQGLLGPTPGVEDLDLAYNYYNPFSSNALNCVNRICVDNGVANNPNLGDYTNNQYVADAMDVNAYAINRLKMQQYSLIATGDLLEGWAGTIAGAFGLEAVELKFHHIPRDDQHRCNLWYERCDKKFTGQDENWAAFFELSIPVIDSGQWGNAGVQLAGRYTDYTDIGTTFDPKIAALWQPRDWLALRASYSTAFQTPSIWSRFVPESSFLQSTNDLVFGDYEATYRTNVYQGNPNLKPEEAEIFNVGFSLSLLDGALNLGVDYANYDFTDRISLIRGPRVVEDDFKAFLEAFPQTDEQNPDRADSIAWVSGMQNPSITRGAAPSYTIVEIGGFYINALSMEHTSLDYYANYTWDTDVIGSLKFGVQATQIKKFDYDLGGGSTGDAVGQLNLDIDVIPVLPEWMAVGSANWNYGNHNAMLRARWNGEVAATWTAREVESLTYYDLTYTYRADGLFGEGSTILEMGARNLLDTYPDPHISAIGGAIELAIHDPRGRMLFMRARHAF